MTPKPTWVVPIIIGARRVAKANGDAERVEGLANLPDRTSPGDSATVILCQIFRLI